jgi:hypothetical protein
LVLLGLPALALCAPPLASADGSEAAIAARVAATLASMTISEKARVLDIFRAADMLTDGAVDMEKATVAQLREEMEERLVPLEVREQSLQYDDQDHVPRNSNIVQSTGGREE